MKRILYILTILFLLIPGITKADDFPEVPNPPKLVNDFEGLLSPSEVESLEAKLVSYDDSTSNEIAIVTLSSLQGYDISDYANRLFEKWKIGKEKKDNGVLILLSKNERKIWIEVGYGLEPVIPDAFAKQVIENIIIPNIKKGEVYNALNEGTDALIQKAAGEFKGEPKKKRGPPFWVIMLIIIILGIIFSKLSRRGKYDNYSGGGYRRGYDGPFGGFGGGGFGGGGGGGGFGGFGGGGSGGGGAGGSW